LVCPRTLARTGGPISHQEEWWLRLSGFFGLLALLLACVGLYGVMSYNVARRTSEIGIRMALGAKRSDMIWMVFRESLVLVLLASRLGFRGARCRAACASQISGLLFGLSADRRPHRWRWQCFLLTVVTMLAAGLPRGGQRKSIRWGAAVRIGSLVLGFGENHGRFSE